MIPRALFRLLQVLTGVAVVCTVVLQNYARLSCHWQWRTQDAFLRMAVFADPQMEGDAKIARLGKRALVDLAFNDAYMRHVYQSMIAPSWTTPLDTLSSYLSSFSPFSSSAATTTARPTHATVLGDLFSSQWIDDIEFNVRLARFRSIFPDPTLLNQGGPVLINITGNHDIGYGYDISQARVERWEEVFGKSNFVTSVKVTAPTGSGDPAATHHEA
ncbi:hypothetical protein BGZ98_006078, partial [Dissophora globulifera]